MRFQSFISILTYALVSIIWSLTALAATDPFEAGPSLIFLGEDHDDPTQNQLFESFVSELVRRGSIDAIATELVSETLNGDFQEYLKGESADDPDFFAKMKVHPLFRPNFEEKLKALFRVNKLYPDRIKFCGIEATAVEHLSMKPVEQLKLAQARLNLISPALVASASRTFGLDIRSIQNPTGNADRETKMASNSLECLHSRHAVLVHVGKGHAYRDRRMTIPGWRTVVDIVEDFSGMAKVVVINMVNISDPTFRQFSELKKTQETKLVSTADISDSAKSMIRTRVDQIDFILPSHQPFVRH